MKTFKMILRKILCASLFFGMLLAFVIHLLWGKRKFFTEDGVLVTELKEDSWPMRTWYKNWGGTCFGYGIMLAPNMHESVLKHELVHTEQQEVGDVAGLVCGLIASTSVGIGGNPGLAALLFFVFWLFLGRINYICASLVAFLRGENSAYTGNTNEEAARAISGQEV